MVPPKEAKGLQHGSDDTDRVYVLKVASPSDLEPASEQRPNIQVLSTQETQHRVDAGLEAWSVIAGAFVALFVQCGPANSYGTFQQYYAQHQLTGFSAQQISWIGSVQLFLTFFGGTLCGHTFDAYGPRALVVIGSSVFVLSLFLVSIFHEYYQLMISQGVLFGIGCSMVYNPSIAVIGQWFVKKRATAAGIVAAGAALGGVVFPIALSRLIPIIGFAWTVRAVAFTSAVLLAFTTVTVKARLPPRGSSNTPWLEPVQAFKTEAGYRWLVLASFFGFWGFWNPFFYIGNFCEYRGFSSEVAFYMLSIMSAGSMIGRLIGFVADKWGRFNLLTLALLFSGIVVLTMWTSITGHAAIYVFSVLFGVGSGLLMGLFPACTAQVSPQEVLGSRIGFLFVVMSFATLTGPPIAGALLAYGPSSNIYAVNAGFSGATMVVGGLCAGVGRFSIGGGVWRAA